MNLPKPCEKCAPYSGDWMMTADEKLKRCTCSRGRALARPPTVGAPLISTEAVTIFVEMLSALQFFPTETGARMAVAEAIRSMCHSMANAKWLVQRVLYLYDRWPGVAELRRVYASKHPPLDGLQPIGISEFYPDGVPSEAPQRQPPIMLPAPREDLISEAPSVDVAVRDLADRVDMNRPRRNADAPQVPETRPPRPAITEADVQEAVANLREERARKELGADLSRQRP